APASEISAATAEAATKIATTAAQITTAATGAATAVIVIVAAIASAGVAGVIASTANLAAVIHSAPDSILRPTNVLTASITCVSSTLAAHISATLIASAGVAAGVSGCAVGWIGIITRYVVDHRQIDSRLVIRIFTRSEER